MSDISKDFINLCLEKNVLQFGEFTLKSKRISPYFYNFGLFNDGISIAKLGKLYAQKIVELDLDFDILFGPAYKGIPLVVATSIALAEHHNINKKYCFNRKLAKDYGDKGEIVGAPLVGKILIIDDVITAGTAIVESINIINKYSATTVGAITSLDRQEVAKDYKLSAIDNLKQNYNLDVYALAKLEDILNYIKNFSPKSTDISKHLNKIIEYKNTYCHI